MKRHEKAPESIDSVRHGGYSALLAVSLKDVAMAALPDRAIFWELIKEERRSHAQKLNE